MPSMGVIKDKPLRVDEIREHLSHVDYPITGKDFIAACSNMSHASKDELEFVKRNLPIDRTYRSSDEIKQVLDL